MDFTDSMFEGGSVVEGSGQSRFALGRHPGRAYWYLADVGAAGLSVWH